jgi:hypothetical protein
MKKTTIINGLIAFAVAAFLFCASSPAFANDSRDSRNTTLTQESWFSVADGADTTPPTAIITAPGDSTDIAVADITTVTDIIGTASDDTGIAEYVLYLSESGKNEWVPFHRSGTAVTDGKLGTLNPQTIENGLYDIGLIVTDLAGNQTSARTTVAIIGQQKIGQFSAVGWDERKRIPAIT